jgi:hypothetical protein
MPFEDFKGCWKIQTSTVRCQPESIVRIGGSPKAVTVVCGEDPYGPGEYFDEDLEKGEPEKIEKKEVYAIFFIEKNPKNGKRRIEASFKEGQIGGSWTAEDNTGGTEYPEQIAEQTAE